MLKNHLTATCIVMLLCMALFGCNKVHQSEKLDKPPLAESNPKYYYYPQKQKKEIVLNTEYINIVSKERLQGKYQNLGIVNSINEGKTIETSDNRGGQKGEKFYTGRLKLKNKMGDEEYLKVVKSFYDDPNTEYVSPSFEDPQVPQTMINLTNFFYVKLYNPNDISYLNYLANQHGALVIEQYEYMPLWYTLSSTSISQNSLDLANAFFETGMFEYAHPDFFLDDPLLSCPTDEYFNSQWGNNNTGQFDGTAGVDIKACSALDIVRPSGAIIDVAFVDDGFDMTHPDLVSNLYGPIKSYDCHTRSSPATLGTNGHGTAMAGITGARENGEGIVGVAPYCRFMFASHVLVPGSSPQQHMQYMRDLAAGIDWSTQNGAEVINLSWRAGWDRFIFEAIERATIYGRNGKGCIVVCASGNTNLPLVEFPANASLNILSVGSVNQCGKRSEKNSCSQDHYGSSAFGVWLEVVAPGTRVLTTDIVGSQGFSTGDYGEVDGTSASAAYVSGVAALILSQNPSLTVTEVRNIIESTAQKVGGYSYGHEPYRYNGPWHQEMGYGLVNAYAAVLNTPRLIGVVPGYQYYGQVVNGD